MLYLNLWAPIGPADAKRPVMVYLHGGQFRRGSPATPLYWGDELARGHEVVVAAFGGDPGKVTVFGQSAGAWAINKLMISPLARVMTSE